MSKGGDQVQETSAQRAQTDYAMNQLQDYNQRWLPVQKNLASQIESMGAPNSAYRQEAEGRTATDTTIKFAGAQNTLQDSMADNVGLGSSKSKLAVAGLGDDQAKSKGLGMTAADSQVDQAYTQGLGAIAAIGQGQKAEVANGLAEQSSASSRQAQSDAETALQSRMGIAKVVGQGVGLAGQQFMKPSAAIPGAAAGIQGNNGSGLTYSPAPTYDFGGGVQGTGLTP